MSRKWSEKLISYWKSEEPIEDQIDRIQGIYNRWTIIFIIIGAAGGGLLGATGNPWGIALAVAGMILMKIWAHIKLSTLRILWEMQQHSE